MYYVLLAVLIRTSIIRKSEEELGLETNAKAGWRTYVGHNADLCIAIKRTTRKMEPGQCRACATSKYERMPSYFKYEV